MSSPYQFFSFNNDCGSLTIDYAREVGNVEGNQSDWIDILSPTVLPLYCDSYRLSVIHASITDFLVPVKLTVVKCSKSTLMQQGSNLFSFLIKESALFVNWF